MKIIEGVKFYTTEEVKGFFQVHRNTVIKYLQQGKLTGVKIGNSWHVSEIALREFLEIPKQLEKMINPNFDSAIMDYYKQLKKESISITEFNLWLDSLTEPMKTHFTIKGIENCKGVLNLQRFVLELRNIPLDDFLKDRLTKEEFNAYKNGVLP